MRYTIIRRIPHTSAVFRSLGVYKTLDAAILVRLGLELVAPGLYIRHVERF